MMTIIACLPVSLKVLILNVSMNLHLSFSHTLSTYVPSSSSCFILYLLKVTVNNLFELYVLICNNIVYCDELSSFSIKLPLYLLFGLHTQTICSFLEAKDRDNASLFQQQCLENTKVFFIGNYYNDTNNTKTPQDHYYTPSSFSSFLLPSPNYIPIEDETVFCESFQQQQFFSSNDYDPHNSIILAHQMATNNNVESIMEECGTNNGQAATNDGDDETYYFNTQSSSPRKRRSKGDRHSKIETARGPRDRRMRLSLDVARKLFGLQDLLGFDKASKTVDWLLTKSKTAILELLPDRSSSFMGVSNSASSTSECEVLSGTGDQSVVKTGDDDQATTKSKEKSPSKKHKEKTTRRNADLHRPLAKATRERARARARERTMERRNNKVGVGQASRSSRACLDQTMDQDVNQLGYSWSIFEDNQCQSVDQPYEMSSHFQFKQGFVGDNSSLMMTGNWSPSLLVQLSAYGRSNT